MNKIVKKRKPKRRVNYFSISLIVLMASGLAFLGSSLFLRNYNNSMSTKIQEIDIQIAALETQNDAVQVDIQTLSSSDRVDSIAADSGMSRNQANIITISDGTTDGE